MLKYQITLNSVQWESSCSMRTDVQTDRQTGRSSRFPQFCERAKKKSSLSECWQKCRVDHAGPCHVMIKFISEQIFTVIMRDAATFQITRSEVRTLARRANTVENGHGSVPRPPYWLLSDQCQLNAGSNCEYPPCGSARSPFTSTRTFLYCNGLYESCDNQRRALLLDARERPAELQEKRKVSTYVCKTGTALCW